MRAIYGMVAVFVVIGFAAAGCGGKAPSKGTGGAPITPGPQAIAEAKEIYSTRCFTCHGMQGKGDGPGSAGLTPQPRDLTLESWQASVTDEHIEKIIKFGGSAVGKSPMMPPNPDLVAKPEVVAALRVQVREFAGK